MPEEPKPILIRPSVDLRKRLEEEAASENRSLSNFIVVVLQKFFKAVDAKRPQREG